MESFSLTNPNLQIAWDATSLSAFRRCPRYYQYRILECWVGQHDNVHLTFGIAYHEAIEKYDRARAKGLSYKEAVHIAVRHALKATGTIRAEDDVFVPWASQDKYKNRFNLIRTIVWYLCQFEHDAFEVVKLPDGEPAVELSFRLELALVSPTGKPYILCGHMDKVVKDADFFQYTDKKTTKGTLSTRYFEGYNPDTQMSAYSVAVSVMFGTGEVRGLIDAAQVGVNFSRFMRGSTSRSKNQIQEWINDTHFWIKQAEGCADRGHWPMNDQACNLFGGCPYRGICSLDPHARQMFLETNFIRGERWNPLRIRGE